MEHYHVFRRTDELHTTIKDLESDEPEKFKKIGIKKCKSCRGTGLKNGYDPNVACKNCTGVGYTNLKELDDEYVPCPSCNGSGMRLVYENSVADCNVCGGDGRLTWVDAIRKGVSLDKIW